MTYQNRNTLMPIRIGYHPIACKIKFETPSYEKTTEHEWVFEDKIQDGGDDGWIWDTVCALNPDMALLPRGCKLFIFSEENDTKEISFIAYITPFKKSIPLFIWETIDFWGDREIFGIYNPKNIDEVYSKVHTPYRHSVFYFIPYRTMCEWESTTEYICVPHIDKTKSNAILFSDLISCATATFHNIKNKKVWVENSSQPLYDYVQWWNSLDQAQKRTSLQIPSKDHRRCTYIIILVVLMTILFSCFRLTKKYLIK